MAFAAIATADADARDAVFLDLALGVADDLFGFRDLAREGGGVAFDADGRAGFFGGGEEGGFVKADDHAGEVVGAEAGEGVVDELFGGGGGVGDVAD